MENDFFLFNEQDKTGNFNNDFKYIILQEELKNKNKLIEKLNEENNKLKLENTKKDNEIKILKD